MTPSGHATMRDPETRLAELRQVAHALWPDRDDSHVLSELVVVMSKIRTAETTVTSSGDARHAEHLLKHHRDVTVAS